MTNKKFNILITIIVAFIVLYLAGSFAYNAYLIEKNDTEYTQTLKDLEENQSENSAGKINEESKED